MTFGPREDDVRVACDMGLMAIGKINLNLGSGTRRIAGFINCDLHHGDTVDMAFDCQDRWPFGDDSVDSIYSSHLLEHLSRPMDFFAEMWRCMRLGAPAMLRMPYGLHRSAWGDLTHVRPWFPESFCCIQPGYGDTSKNRQYNGNGPAFWAQNTTVILSKGWSRWYRWPLRGLLWWGAHNFPGVAEELWVFLKKTTREDRSRPANIVGMSLALKGHPRPGDDQESAVGVFSVEHPTRFEQSLVPWRDT